MRARFAHFFRRLIPTAALWALCGSAILSTAVQAGPGHDHGHGHGADTPSEKQINPRVAMTSDDYELVVILKEHDLVLYLDKREDTSPVTDAKIDLTVNNVTGAAQLQPDGSYLFHSPELETHAVLEIIAAIARAGANDLLVGKLDGSTAHEEHGDADPFGHDHAIHHANDPKQQTSISAITRLNNRLSAHPFTVFFVGTLFGFLISILLRSKSAATVALLYVSLACLAPNPAQATPGHDHRHDHGHAAAQNNHHDHKVTQDAPGRVSDGLIFVPKPTQRLLEIRTQILKAETVKRAQRLIGRVIADPNRNGLVQSTIRGRISPPKNGLPVLGQTVSAGETLALVEPAFEPIDASDVRQTAGDLEQRMAVLKARLTRRRQLVDKKIASRATLQDLEIEIEGLKARRKQLDESRSKPEALHAPVSGVVADVRVVAGQVVASADTLYQIVDPNNFWVEAITFDPKLSTAASAKAMTADNRLLDLEFIGRSRTLQQQATVLQYEIKAPSKSLSIGEPLTVSVETGEPVTGIIVPKEAVAEAPNGQRVAFVRQDPEHYKAVPVRTEDLDGTRFHILAGLAEGDQIIVHGASLVSQIR